MREYTYVGAAVTSGMVDDDDGTLRRLEGRVSVVVTS